jgi:hypothetical protein
MPAIFLFILPRIKPFLLTIEEKYCLMGIVQYENCTLVIVEEKCFEIWIFEGENNARIITIKNRCHKSTNQQTKQVHLSLCDIAFKRN